jgi:hypothetical protein
MKFRNLINASADQEMAALRAKKAEEKKNAGK